MRSKEQIEKDLEALQSQYNTLCARYGDALISLRYWNEQKDNLEQDIDKLGEVQKNLNVELKNATAAHSAANDGGVGPELHKEDVDK